MIELNLKFLSYTDEEVNTNLTLLSSIHNSKLEVWMQGKIYSK